MATIRLDHLYRETHHWDDSVAWWERLGFAFAEQWGTPPHRAGRLVHDACSVVLAEVPGDRPAEASVFLATDDLTAIAVATGSPVEETHWGTTLVSLTDPDGRVHRFEPGGDR